MPDPWSPSSRPERADPGAFRAVAPPTLTLQNAHMSTKPDEDRAIDEVVSRLSEKFQALSPEHIKDVVDQELHRFDGGRVRDFVPVLVERAAKQRLKAEAGAPVIDAAEVRAPE